MLGTARGRVIEFDEHRGLGVVERADNHERFAFHCTEILDGSRTIEIGAEVSFDLIAGPSGRVEAGSLRP